MDSKKTNNVKKRKVNSKLISDDLEEQLDAFADIIIDIFLNGNHEQRNNEKQTRDSSREND